MCQRTERKINSALPGSRLQRPVIDPDNLNEPSHAPFVYFLNMTPEARVFLQFKRVDIFQLQPHSHTNIQNTHRPLVLVLILALVGKPDSSKLLRQKQKRKQQKMPSGALCDFEHRRRPLYSRIRWQPLTLRCHSPPVTPERSGPDQSHTQSFWGRPCPAGWPPAGLGCRGRRATGPAGANLRRTEKRQVWKPTPPCG